MIFFLSLISKALVAKSSPNNWCIYIYFLLCTDLFYTSNLDYGQIFQFLWEIITQNKNQTRTPKPLNITNEYVWK